MTQRELTATGILLEARQKEAADIRGQYPNGYETMPKDKQAYADGLQADIERLTVTFGEGTKELRGNQRSVLTNANGPLSLDNNRLMTPGARDDMAPDQYGFSRYQREARGRLMNFRDNEQGRRMAELFGCLAIRNASNLGDSAIMMEAKSILRDRHGIDGEMINPRMNDLMGGQNRDLTSAVESYGGVLTPTVLEAAILILQEEYGVIEKYANVVPMGAGKIKWPKRFQGPAAIHTLETLPSNFDKQLQFNSFELNAKDAYCFVSFPNQLSQDSIIPLGDYVAGQIAWAMGYRWNDDAINGDGSANYGNISGLVQQFNATLQSGGANPGLYAATSGSATDWTKITLQDFNNTKAKMRLFSPTTTNWRWFCSWAFYNIAMQPLQANGQYGFETTFQDGVVKTTTGSQRFQGHEVVIIPAPLLPSSAASAQQVCYFGDMSMAIAWGTRLGLEILSSNVAGLSFITNSTYVRGIQRGDIAVHSVGLDTVDPAGTHIAGPLVAMKTAS